MSEAKDSEHYPRPLETAQYATKERHPQESATAQPADESKTTNGTPANFYDRFTVNGVKMDFYQIALLYEITDPCLQHALKKLLRAGRSHKGIHEDVRNAIDTLKRWEELHPKDKEETILSAMVSA